MNIYFGGAGDHCDQPRTTAARHRHLALPATLSHSPPGRSSCWCWSRPFGRQQQLFQISFNIVAVSRPLWPACYLKQKQFNIEHLPNAKHQRIRKSNYLEETLMLFIFLSPPTSLPGKIVTVEKFLESFLSRNKDERSFKTPSLLAAPVDCHPCVSSHYDG